MKLLIEKLLGAGGFARVYRAYDTVEGVAEVNVAKQRNGPTGAAKLTFMNEYTRFEDQAPTDYDNIRGEWVE